MTLGWRRELLRAWRATQLVAHLLAGLTLAPLLPLLASERFGGGRRRDDALVRWWLRGVLRILNVRVRIEGRVESDPTLFVANHISWLDIPVLRAACDAGFLAKSEVRRWPLIGGMAALAGTVFFERGTPDASRAAADTLTWRLARGRSVLVFPEGTTSDGREVRHFHGRLYQAAIRLEARVQAVAIRYLGAHGLHPHVPFLGQDDLASHLWRLLGEREIRAELYFCPPHASAGGERRRLAEATRDQVLAALGLDQPARTNALP
jgi:1-acyl-sn-glycerol-3-phosphate acyltransferase